LYFIAVLTSAAELPDPEDFNRLAVNDPNFISRYFLKYKHLPVSSGAFELHTNIFSTSIKLNNPKVAIESGLFLSEQQWDDISQTRYSKILNGLGILYRKNGQYKKAISAYQCAIRYADGNQKERVKLLLNMHLSQRKLGLYNDAADSLDQAEYLVTDESAKRRIQQKKARLNLIGGNYEAAQRKFIKLFRDDSLDGTSEEAVRSGLNLLNSLVLQGKYHQFWRYHNSVKQRIFDLKVENYHYFYHYIIMESVVNAKMLPSQVQFERIAYTLERSTFLYPYGLEDSLKKYVEIVGKPWVTRHVRPFMKQNILQASAKEVPDALLNQLCQNDIN
jgi:tetratricopeptide (TPR) repeat protein